MLITDINNGFMELEKKRVKMSDFEAFWLKAVTELKNAEDDLEKLSKELKYVKILGFVLLPIAFWLGTLSNTKTNPYLWGGLLML